MKTSTIAIITLSTALLASAGLNAGQYFAARNIAEEVMLDKNPDWVTNGLPEFTAAAYGAPDAWLWHPEPRGISRMRAEFAPAGSPQLSAMLTGVHKGAGTVEATTRLLQWYLQGQDKLVANFFPVFNHPRNCDENAAVFRSILMRASIQSRVVNFQYADGDGGAAHTALEVWVPAEERWIYVDAHYGAISNGNTMETAANTKLLTIYTVSNTAMLEDTFTNGMREFAIEGHTPRQRLRLLQ